MLCELKVENLALIETLRLSFDNYMDSSGLIVMTGETGAGKSIMLRAIHLLTGARTTSDWVRTGAENCTVEALFEVRPEHGVLLDMLREGGFGEDTTIIIKRIVQSNGRSRLYVNGSLATAKTVSDIADNLLSIASQHDHQQLLQPSFHLDFLDNLGDLLEQRETFKDLFGLWRKNRDELQDLLRQEKDKEEKKDLLRFQVNEIREADLTIGEDDDLAAEKLRLKSADQLIKLSHESYSFFASTFQEGFTQVRKNMELAAALDPQAQKLAEDLAGYSYQVEDLASELRHYRDALENDPVRLEYVSGRMDLIRQMKRKYGDTIAAIHAHAQKAEKELASLENLEIRMEHLQKEVAELEKKVLAAAADLSAERRLAGKKLEKGMEKELASLAFNRAAFLVRFQEDPTDIAQIRSHGWDRVEFFFSANPGEPPRPLAKVASGGELSRLMLALRCLLAQRDMVETVIFDEVDAGIGGEAAEAVARKIQELAGHHQVFCITHLPQIAARGTDHFLVLKTVDDGRTQSKFSRLSHEERVQELARMLAGESVSSKTHAWAMELLEKGGAKA